MVTVGAIGLGFGLSQLLLAGNDTVPISVWHGGGMRVLSAVQLH